ncbi:MAG: TolC family protein, partial [Prevotella sp.]|nr:TolC family protein [Prevotella sp.]
MKRIRINRCLSFAWLVAVTMPVGAQRLLTLDSCRAMALQNNKQMQISRTKQEVAADIRRSARTKYLPHVNAIGAYEHTSKEVSLLSDEQKTALSNLGS